jgi:hypothetical protein
MAEFLLGVVLSITPGLITGWIIWSIIGGLMNHYSYCRHPASEQITVAASIPAIVQRVHTEPSAVFSATHAAQPAIPHVVVTPVLMPLGAPLQALPQWPGRSPIIFEAPELELLQQPDK